MPDSGSDKQTQLLHQILDELRDMNGRLARVDERSMSNSNDVQQLRDERIVPLEDQADANRTRSNRNQLILTAALTTLSAIVTLGATLAAGII